MIQYVWVKCSDKLPELLDELCLVFSENGKEGGFPPRGYDCVHIQDYFSDITNGLDENGNQLYTKRYLTQGITHWAYYPELPVGGN